MLHVKIGSKTLHDYSNLEGYFAEFRNDLIGINTYIPTPFGLKKMVYADWTASGRLSSKIEKKISMHPYGSEFYQRIYDGMVSDGKENH